MNIKKIYFHSLQNEEHVQFNKYVQEYVGELDAETLRIEVQTADHLLKFNAETAVLDLVQKNTYTERVNLADDQRDQPIRGFFAVVKGMLHHYDPAIRQPAENINIINQKFSDICYLSNEKQSAACTSFLGALKAALADINTLGLSAWVTEIEKTQANFDEVVRSRNDEDDARPAYNMKAARVATDESYKTLVDRINAMITIDGDAKFATFVTKLNNRIDQYHASIARRRGQMQETTVG